MWKLFIGNLSVIAAHVCGMLGVFFFYADIIKSKIFLYTYFFLKQRCKALEIFVDFLINNIQKKHFYKSGLMCLANPCLIFIMLSIIRVLLYKGIKCNNPYTKVTGCLCVFVCLCVGSS